MKSSRLRKELAGLYGQESFADFATRRRMVRNTETIKTFLDEVDDVVRSVEAHAKSKR